MFSEYYSLNTLEITAQLTKNGPYIWADPEKFQKSILFRPAANREIRCASGRLNAETEKKCYSITRKATLTCTSESIY